MPPTLIVIEPTPRQVILDSSELKVIVRAWDANGIESVTVNGENASFIDEITRRKDINLTKGENTITVVATDTKNNQKEETIKVYYGDYGELFYFVQITDTHMGVDWKILLEPFTDGEGNINLDEFNLGDVMDAVLKLKTEPITKLERLLHVVDETNSLDPNPAFVVVTGDLVEASTSDFPLPQIPPFPIPGLPDLGVIQWDIYNDAIEYLNDDIPTYNVPGNHDRYTRYAIGNDQLDTYNDNIKSIGDRLRNIFP